MPNWCVNQVDISGDEAQVAELIALVRDGDNAFSFRKILPPPDSDAYKITDKQNAFQCGCEATFVKTSPAVEHDPFDPSEGGMPPKQEGYWAVDGIAVHYAKSEATGDAAIVANSIRGAEVCPIHQKHKNSDHPDWWYNWNLNNWGTKWGSSDTWHDRLDNGETHEGRTSYTFETAWSPAVPVVAALAEKFPSLAIDHRYCEGGNGYAGETIYQNGEVVSHREFDAGFYPEGAFYPEGDPDHDSYERNYDKVPMTDFEKFCDEYFGGVVGG